MRLLFNLRRYATKQKPYELPLPNRPLTREEVSGPSRIIAWTPIIAAVTSPTLRSVLGALVCAGLSAILIGQLLRHLWRRSWLLLGTFSVAGLGVGVIYGAIAGRPLSASAALFGLAAALLSVFCEQLIRAELALNHIETLQEQAADAERRFESTRPDVRYLPIDDSGSGAA